MAKNLFLPQKIISIFIRFAMFSFVFLLCLFVFKPVSLADSSSYLQVSLNEIKNSNGSMSFSLSDYSYLLGDYHSSLETYNPANPILATDNTQYLLNIYTDNSPTPSSQYVLPALLLEFWDGQDSSGNLTGGINELNSSLLSFTIPYDSANPVTSIGIVSGTETKISVPSWCHTFSKYMSEGDTDADANGEVSFLQNVLTKQGSDVSADDSGSFGDATFNALKAFQLKYGITPQSGLDRKLTTAQLNALYGCKIQTPVLSGISVTNPANKLTYLVGDRLSVTGLEVTGYYTNGDPRVEPVTAGNISGFDSSIPGKETLTVTYAGQTAAYNINIVADAIPVASITLNASASKLSSGDTFQLNALFTPSNATNQNVIWSSDTPTVATVDGTGVVTAVAPGNAIITATASDTAKGIFTAKDSVTVVAKTVSSSSSPLKDNAKRIADVQKYIKALNAYLVSNNNLPDDNNSGSGCLLGLSASPTPGQMAQYAHPMTSMLCADANNAIKSSVPALPADDNAINSLTGAYVYSAYSSSGDWNCGSGATGDGTACNNFNITYFMNGANQPCGPGQPIPADSGSGFTYCWYDSGAADKIISFNFGVANEVDKIRAKRGAILITVPKGTDMTNLKPTITLSPGATVSPSAGTPQNFTSPVTYTVTSQNGSATQSYIIAVTAKAVASGTGGEVSTPPPSRTPSSDATLSNLVISPGTLSPAFSSDVTSYTDNIAIGTNSNVNVSATTTQNQAQYKVNGNGVGGSYISLGSDAITNGVTVIVTAPDGTTTKTYTVKFSTLPNPAINSFSIGNAIGIFTGNNINVSVSGNTDVTSLVPTFSVSNGSVVTINGVKQQSGTTSNDFTNSVTYTVTALYGGTNASATYTVLVLTGICQVSSALDLCNQYTNAQDCQNQGGSQNCTYSCSGTVPSCSSLSNSLNSQSCYAAGCSHTDSPICTGNPTVTDCSVFNNDRNSCTSGLAIGCQWDENSGTCSGNFNASCSSSSIGNDQTTCAKIGCTFLQAYTCYGNPNTTCSQAMSGQQCQDMGCNFSCVTNTGGRGGRVCQTQTTQSSCQSYSQCQWVANPTAYNYSKSSIASISSALKAIEQKLLKLFLGR